MDIVHTYLGRSKMCPLSLIWYRRLFDDLRIAQVLIDHLIKPSAERMERITSFIDTRREIGTGAFFTEIGSLNFPILRDVEIFCQVSSPLTYTLGRNAPLLRHCRLHCSYLLLPLSSNLVVIDYSSTLLGEGTNVNHLLEFLPRVAHSLEHLRFRPPFNICFAAGGLKINLQNLKSLLIENNYAIMDHILVPNLIYFAAPRLFFVEVGKMFNDFSAPKFQSIQFYQVSLTPLLA